MKVITSASALVLVVLLSTSVVAQEAPRRPPTPDAQLAAIAKLDMMVGEWRGEGWMEFGGRRSPFRGTEKVQRKLNGVALLVEGAFTSRPAGSEVDIPVHTTLGVISYDPKSKAYRFASWLATGTSGERELELLDDGKGWRWDIEIPGMGTTRYTTTFDDGEWFEIGERSKDGKEWTKFFEMRLKRASN